MIIEIKHLCLVQKGDSSFTFVGLSVQLLHTSWFSQSRKLGRTTFTSWFIFLLLLEHWQDIETPMLPIWTQYHLLFLRRFYRNWFIPLFFHSRRSLHHWYIFFSTFVLVLVRCPFWRHIFYILRGLSGRSVIVCLPSNKVWGREHLMWDTHTVPYRPKLYV